MEQKKEKLAIITEDGHEGIQKLKDRKLTDLFSFDAITSVKQAESLPSSTDYTGAFIMTMGNKMTFTDARAIAEIVVEKSPKLRWVHTLTTGVDFLLSLKLSEAKHITFTNAKGAYTRPLAEFVLMTVLYFAKKMPVFMKQKREHKYEKHVTQLAHKAHVGIIGYGNVGRAVAKLLKDSLEAKIYAITNDPVSEEEKASLEFVGKTEDMDKMFPKVDYVVTILPLTPKTKGLINASTFKLMKPETIFMNIGRGPAVNEKDLIEALKKGTIAGAGLDVFEVEPLPQDSPLYDMDNVLLTPHSTDITDNMLDLSLDCFQTTLHNFLHNKPHFNKVNMELGY
eukprot:TRINITY_DN6851_c0_g1_i10.p1 TRINITY_DN6851_c0_g1~~TRINITY_DN6851_c0_g1_i10.p1  ORF type:complete len:339 (-),score=114.65 TRINITY_DN6851_c0_g1_i10:139-1155(-)